MAIERLQLFVRFGNISGLLPFRMVVDVETGKFKRFNFSWYHPANWWFIFLLIIQSTLTILNFHVTWTVNSNEFMYTLSSGIDTLSFTILMWTPRLLLFHLRKMWMVFDSLGRIDRHLDKYNQINQCSIRRQTIIGIIICFALVMFYLRLSHLSILIAIN